MLLCCTMPEIIINDIPVNFPYQHPYNVQKAYMEKVVECIRDSKNGVLESPTGTGKTLSLLCASLAWLKWENAKIETFLECHSEDDTSNASIMSPLTSKIIYASRTHSQLTQVIRELKGTDYKNTKMAVVASRDHLCIHPELINETNASKTQKCKSKISTKIQSAVLTESTGTCEGQQTLCSFYNGYEKLKNDDEFRDSIQDKILDIEELVTEGRLNKFCPYFMSREVLQAADIVFMPYNYLLDTNICRLITVDLTNSVIILDEAHNVPQICEDAASIEFKSSHIVAALQEVELISDLCSADQPKTFQSSELKHLTRLIERLKGAVDEIHLPSLLSAKAFDGDFIFMLMDKADIDFQIAKNVNLLIHNALEYLTDYIEKTKTLQEFRGTGLRKINEILRTIFSECGDEFRENIKNHYRVYVEWEKKVAETQLSQTNGPVKVVHFWCFSPKFGLEYLLNRKHVRSIIFTSGTMSPFDAFISTLGITIEVTLQNSHIIGDSQVLVEIISNGSDKEMLSSSYRNRENPKYLNSLGSTILSLCPVVPHGLLIFFPSYIILNLCISQWQDSGIWQQINKSKKIFVESTSKEEFENTMKNYYQAIGDATKGAIFMAVCRGKVSEGLDFADNNGRAVIITGMPYPPFTDPKIRLKRQYMQDQHTAESNLMDGNQWYEMMMISAVNQAIGRVIRHKNDYGAILLCDCRFDNQRQKRLLSSWMQKHLKIPRASNSFGAVIISISRFFKNQQSMSNDSLSSSNENTPTKSESETQIVGATQPTNSESPITDCMKLMSALPLSSPTSSNIRNVDIGLVGVPSSLEKRRCTINLSQNFDEDV